jgi:hypothetical protein
LHLCLLGPGPTYYLSKLKLDRDLHENVDRCPETRGGRELPPANGLNRLFVESEAESAEDPHVTDRPVGAHHDLQDDVTFNPALACFFGVARTCFDQQSRRVDSTPCAIRTAPGSPTRSFAET